jgi:nicotinamidase-related amidase
MPQEAGSPSSEPVQTTDIQKFQEQRLREILDPTKPSVLLIIDMQNDFVSEDGKSARNWHHNIVPMQAIIPNIERVTQMFDAMGKPVVRTINYENVNERTNAGKDRAVFMEQVRSSEDEAFGVACVRGSNGAELALPARDGDIIIEKNRSSAYTPDLENYLKEKGITTIFITGVKTQRCVEATVRDLYDKSDVHVVVLEDCVASDDVVQHEARLKEMKQFYPPVITSDQLAEVWKDSLPQQPQAAD